MIPEPPPDHAQGPDGAWVHDPGCFWCQVLPDSRVRRRLWQWKLRWSRPGREPRG